MKRNVSLALIVFSVAFTIGKSQSIKNINAVQDGEKIQITYDLEDTESNDYFIRAYASNDGGKNFGIGISKATGDVNAMVKSGKQRKIVWNAAEEVGEFRGMMRFKVIGLSNTAIGKSENKDFVVGLMEIKKVSRDKLSLTISLFCKAPVSTSFQNTSYIVDNNGTTYRLAGGVVGNQIYSAKQNFSANELWYGELIFQVSKQNPIYSGGAITECQIGLVYEGGGQLSFPNVKL